jgi:Ca2+-binding RTX toxin-like protein
MRRRVILMVVAMLAVLALAGGVALAATIDGTNGNDRLIGTDRADQIDGRGGQDVIRGHEGADTLDGGAGADDIWAGAEDEFAQDSVTGGGGDDVIRAFNKPASKDIIDCGSGFDRAVVDSKDVLSGCNRVVRP